MLRLDKLHKFPIIVVPPLGHCLWMAYEACWICIKFKMVWNSWNVVDSDWKESTPVNLRSKKKMEGISDYFSMLIFARLDWY